MSVGLLLVRLGLERSILLQWVLGMKRCDRTFQLSNGLPLVKIRREGKV